MATSTFDLLLRAATPLDEVRRRVLRATAKVPALGHMVRKRELRVLGQASVSLAVLFALTLRAPGLLYVLGPAVFGVAHVASDLRYLVLRRALPRAWTTTIWLFCAAMVLLRLAEFARPDLLPFARFEVALGWGWPVVGIVAGAAAAGHARRAVWLLPLALGLWVAAQLQPRLATTLFAYAHNWVALVLWALLFRRRFAFAAPILALVVGGSWLLVSTTALPWAHLTSAWDMRMVDDILNVTSGLPDRLGLGLGLSYVFSQAIHYSVWLAWIPQEDVRAEGTLSFRMSLRSLLRDFGGWGLLATVLLMVALIAASFVSVHRTRSMYLSAAVFHGYLEVAMLAFFLARGRHTLSNGT